jgi:PAS domain S-box-containing protein
VKLTLDNEAVALVCMEDITEQRRREQRISEQAALLDIAQDMVVVVDSQHRIQYWNKRAEELTGVHRTHAEGREFASLVFGSKTEPFLTAWSQLLKNSEWTGDFEVPRPRGQRLILHTRAQLMKSEQGGQSSAMIVCTDVSAERNLESQMLRMQRLDNLGSLATGVAHDLNNILVPIMMSVDMLAPLAQDAEMKSMIQLLRSSSQRGADIIKQLLLFGRGAPVSRCNTRPTVLVEEVAHLVRETFPKNIHTSFKTAENLREIFVDPTQLHQVLLNLCVNARDAMKEHGGTLSLEVKDIGIEHSDTALIPEAKPGAYVMFRVKDSGIGIPPEIMDRIFDPFFTTKPIGQGTGMGLSTVIGIVHKHEGFIRVQSEVGQGTEFSVFIPAREIPASQTSTSITLENYRGNGETILIVDDEAGIRKVLKQGLTTNGYTVLEATDGAIGVATFADHLETIALVISDIMMPSMDGRNAIECMRMLRPDIPILAISGLVQASEIPHHKGAITRVIPKPFELPQILQVIKEMFALQNQSKASRALSSQV